tara:strand:- start:312 stop:482 length:171 start_codon:yes stop_codon:yes gene_type:complete
MRTVKIEVQEFEKLLKLRYKMESYFKYEKDENFNSIADSAIEQAKELLTQLKKFDQ